MTITAKQVKELREMTGVGMMECKKALVQVDGDMDAAVELMRKSGQAKAAKKAAGIAAEGIVVMALNDDGKQAAMIEVNCETDFVAREKAFVSFAQDVADLALAHCSADLDALNALSMADGRSVDEARQALVTTIGENIRIRRVQLIKASGVLGDYLHGVRIGVLVSLSEDNQELARDIAMHVAAARPEVVAGSDVSQQLIDKEKEIFTAQALDSGKPPEIVEKMVGGRIKKFLREISLLGQPFVKDPNQTVEQLLKAKQASVEGFIRFEVGEGIEKKQDNFVEDVRAQVQGN